MAKPSIAILGGDLRQCYTAEYLHSCGFHVTCFHTPDFPYHSGILLEQELSQALTQAEVILLPTPFPKTASIYFRRTNSTRPACQMSCGAP